MVAMTWGRSPPAAGSPPVARAALHAPTRPSSSLWGRERRSRDGSAASSSAVAGSVSRAGRIRRRGPVTRSGLRRVPVAVPWPVSGPVRGLVAVFITVIRCSNWSVVAKISRCCRPCRGLRRKAPWSWRSSSSEGSAPSWSSASAQLRATRARKSASFSAAVRVRACSIAAAASGRQLCRTRSRASVMTVAAREATSPAATAAPSSGCTGGDGPAGESLPGQQRVGQAEPAPGLRGADPQPRPQELRRVPVPVIQHRFRHRRLSRSGASGGSRGQGRAGGNRPNRPAGGSRSNGRAGGSRGQGGAGGFRGSGCAGLPPGGLSRQPVVHAVTAPAATPAAAAADCFLVRSTAAAATSCRYSTARETSSTPPAKSDAARKPHDPASSTAVEPTARSAARAASIPDCPTGAAPRSVPSASSPQAVKSLMKSLTASMARVYLRAPTKVMGTVPPRNDSGTAHPAEPQTNCDHAPRWVRGHGCAPKTAARG